MANPRTGLDDLIAKRHWAASMSATGEREYADKLNAAIQPATASEDVSE